MLEIVDQKQRLSVAQEVGQLAGGRRGSTPFKIQRLDDGIEYLIDGGHRRQRHVGHTVGEAAGLVACQLLGQAALADAARLHQRQQAHVGVVKRGAQLGQF